MKKLISGMFIGLLSFATLAQSTNEKEEKGKKEISVPVAVKNAFAKDFPTVEKSKWSKEDDNFEVEFKNKGTELSATYNAAGIRLEVETEIETAMLPSAVTAYLTKNYAAYKVTEAARIVDKSNVTTYEAEIKNGKEKMDVIFTEKGQFIKTVKPD